MVLIYTHKITNRFAYIMKHLFVQMMGAEIDFTTKVEDFIRHQGPKITYTKQPLQNEFFVRSNDLLFEQGINDIEVRVGSWEGVPCFFKTDERSNIPFDIFSASFYLLSRYEEYLPHVKDELGRFPATASIAYENGFLETPVVDLWVGMLADRLKDRFPEIRLKTRTYQFTSVINVTTSHSFAMKGFQRSVGGFFRDLFHLKLSRVWKRVLVWFALTKDPYDNFSELIEIHKGLGAKTMFFFQFADYGLHDKNISIYKNHFRYLIKSVADYSIVSLSASMEAGKDVAVLKREKQRLSNLINRKIKYSRMRYNKVSVPHSYRDLVKAEFTDDYSMGYTHHIGFRASTSIPFSFYDINLESQQPIKVHPFVCCDYALRGYRKKEAVEAKLDGIYQQVKKANGQLILVFSNELLGEGHRIHWLGLYQSLLKRYHV